MTVDWFDPLPIDEYQALNEKNGENIPDSVPVEPPLGGLDIRVGPILRLCGLLENGPDYRASIMLLIKAGEGSVEPHITYKIGPSLPEFKGQFGEGEFPAVKYHEEHGYQFWRFNIKLQLTSYEQKIQYYINNTFRQSQQFFVPAAQDSFNVVSFSCNGFSLATDTSEYKSSLWLDVLRKHSQQHYHVMLGGGDQIYCDAIKIKSKLLEDWTTEIDAHKKAKAKATPELVAEFEDYYLNAYIGWFGHGFWQGKNGGTAQKTFPLSMAQIPSVNLFDDHDIIDGYGSYNDRTMSSEVFKAIGNTAYKYYMLFQQQISVEEKAYYDDPSWIIANKKGPYIDQPAHSVYMRLGREISLLGLDCRTERKLKQIISQDTYKVIFDRLELEIKAAPDTKHLLVMLGVPILYPRLVWLEWILTSSVLKPVRKLAERGIIAKGLVNEFDGGVEVLDDLNDHWCAKDHKKERNYLLMKLLNFGAEHGVRITILSGDVHLCAISRLKTKYSHHVHSHPLTHSPGELQEKNRDVLEHPEHDPRLIFNVISSAIINAPPPDAMAALLNKRSKIHHYNRDTDEDVVPLFTSDPDGEERSNHQFMNKRNWLDLILGKQSVLYKDQVGQGVKKFPSPLFEKDLQEFAEKEQDPRYVKYPLDENSLVTTLHVEKDGNDYSATTASYEVLIPHLAGKYSLDKVAIKHLDGTA